MNAWITLEEKGGRNTAVAATESEVVIDVPDRGKAWNSMIVQNFDPNCEIEVSLDADPTGAARTWKLPKNIGMANLMPEDGIFFRTVTIKNMDAANALTADKIIVQASRKVLRR